MSSEKKVCSVSTLSSFSLPLSWGTYSISYRCPNFVHKVWTILGQISALAGKLKLLFESLFLNLPESNKYFKCELYNQKGQSSI